MQRKRLLRIATVPISLQLLLRGQLEFMQANGFDILAVSSAGKETSYLQTQGIPHREIMLTRRITPLIDFFAILQLVFIILRYRPHILHSHTPKAGLVGMTAAWLCRVPVRMHTVAGLPLMEAKGWRRTMLVAVEKFTYSMATHIYPNSNGLKEFIRKEFGLERKIKVIGKGSSNGIDTDYFSRREELVREAEQIRARHKISSDEMVFCFVGRIVDDKGIRELTEAFVKLALEISARLMLVGEFEDQSKPVADTARDLIRGHPGVIHAGFQTDIRPWLLAADIFVLPSYREGFPNVVMQAACLDLPCIVSDINGCNEMIVDRQSGLLIPPKDARALYLSMKSLARNSEDRKRYAREARSFIVANFGQQLVWNEILHEYREALK